jgi:type IX secretion system PorP/SprF family membrane protein
MNTIKNKSMRLIHIHTILFLILLGTNTAKAQITEYQSMYFQNQYIANPAMAGLEKGLNANMAYQGQLNAVPGNPVLMNATVDYNYGKRVGLGLNANSDEAGLINRTRIMATYAYHLPLNDEQKLNFGLSVGAKFTSLDYDKIIGNPDDPSAQNYNEGGALDGDFGISYTTTLLTIQGALPNLNGLFLEDNDIIRKYVDRPLFYASASYKIYVSSRINDFNIEPLVAYRNFRGYRDILDVGGRFNMPEYKIDLTGIYHSNQIISSAFGIKIEQLGIFLSYSKYIGNSGAYANDTFEIGINYRFLN